VAVPLTLKVFKGDELVTSKDYDRDIIKIGRLSSAHLVLDDEKVSRIHSVIEVAADGSLSIIDMGSVEGTFVNGKRVNKGTLAFGDEVKVGNTTIKVEAAGAAPTVAAVTAAVVPPPSVAQVIATAPVEVAAPAVVVAAPAPIPVQAPAPKPPPAPRVEARVQNESTGDRAHAAPRRRKGSGPLGLELRFLWGDQMVGEFFLPPTQEKTFRVGSAAGVDFEMGDDRFGAPVFDLVKFGKNGATLRFNSKMKGEFTHGDAAPVTLEQARKQGSAAGDGDAQSITLSNDDFAWVDLGGVVVEVFFQPQPKPVFVELADSVDFTVLNIFLFMFFLGAVFVITAANLTAEGEGFDDELNANSSRIAKLLIKPAEKNPILQKFEKQKKDSGEVAQKHKGDEGKMGKKNAPERSAHVAPKGDPSNKDQARLLAAKVFGGTNGGISAIFGHQGIGGELKSAMGNMFGAAAGDSGGFGGMGIRGSGSGGGGVGDSIGIGGIGTKGRGGGTGGYGSGVGVLGGKKDVDIGITSSDPTVMGSLDKELIRQVIRRNVGKIRYCYETQLTRNPKLNGKVAIKFVISPSGTVSTASVAQSTANNPELESCVASRVRLLEFPKPKGGGMVIVTYPFVFSQAGQ
jgi:TonB family protein